MPACCRICALVRLAVSAAKVRVEDAAAGSREVLDRGLQAADRRLEAALDQPSELRRLLTAVSATSTRCMVLLAPATVGAFCCDRVCVVLGDRGIRRGEAQDRAIADDVDVLRSAQGHQTAVNRGSRGAVRRGTRNRADPAVAIHHAVDGQAPPVPAEIPPPAAPATSWPIAMSRPSAADRRNTPPDSTAVTPVCWVFWLTASVVQQRAQHAIGVLVVGREDVLTVDAQAVQVA